MVTPRYAIYFAPEPGTPLEAFGRQWLGRDHEGAITAQLRLSDLTPRRLADLTRGPRHFGIHCTLKPPFRLNDGTTAQSLLTAARVLATSLTPIEIPPLQLDVIGKFIALTPSTSSAKLEMIAASVVRAFEGYRRPLTQEQEAEYQRNRLTVHQEQMLEHWGYPYVMEEFKFHMTLTDPIPDDRERNAIMDALYELAGPLLGQPIPLRQIAVFHEPDPAQHMMLLARCPFGRTA